MTKEAEFQKLVHDLFRYVDKDTLTDHLAEAFSAFIKEEIDNGCEEITGQSISCKVRLQHTIIKFFNQIDQINNKDLVSA